MTVAPFPLLSLHLFNLLPGHLEFILVDPPFLIEPCLVCLQLPCLLHVIGACRVLHCLFYHILHPHHLVLESTHLLVHHILRVLVLFVHDCHHEHQRVLNVQQIAKQRVFLGHSDGQLGL